MALMLTGVCHGDASKIGLGKLARIIVLMAVG